MQALRLRRVIPEIKIQVKLKYRIQKLALAILSFILVKPRLVRQIEPGKFEEVERIPYRHEQNIYKDIV